MDRNKLFMLLLGLGMVAVLAGGFILGVQPSLQAAAAADAERIQAVADNRVNQATLDSLVAENKKVGELTDQLNKLRQSVPASENMSAFIDGVREAATAEGLTVQGITPTDPIAYAPQGAAAPAAGAPSASSSTGTPSPTPTPTPTPSATAAPSAAAAQSPVTYSDPSITAANFLAVSVKVGVAGPLDRVIAFVHRLQNGPRLFVVNAFDGGADGSGDGPTTSTAGPSETYTVTGYVYVLTEAPAQTPTPAPTASK